MNDTNNGSAVLENAEGANEETMQAETLQEEEMLTLEDACGYNLRDCYSKEGADLEGFVAELSHLSDVTKIYTVRSKDITIASFMTQGTHSNGAPVYIYRVLSPEAIEHFEQTGYLGLPTEQGGTKPAKPLSLAMRKDNEQLLSEESEQIHFHLMIAGSEEIPRHMYVSETARDQLFRRVGLKGETSRMSKKLATDLAAASYLGDLNENVKLVVREIIDSSDAKVSKVFGYMSQKYQPINMMVIPRAVERLRESASLGKLEIAKWQVTQDFAEIWLEFPEAADDYTAAYGLPKRLVPGIHMYTSDNGNGSVTIEATNRIEAGLAIGEERVRRVHRGGVQQDERLQELTETQIVNEVETEVLPKMTAFPMALVERLGVEIGDEDLSKSLGRRRNKALVLRCIRAGLKALKLNEVLGTARKKVLMEKLRTEIHGDIRYTEYDVAMILMSLGDRVHVTGRDLTMRIAKACGKAAAVPYYSLVLQEAAAGEDIFIEDAD